MSSNSKHRTSQSGAIGLWLIVVTTVISLVLLLSWVKQGGFGPGQAGKSEPSDAFDPPAAELKLLAAEVVSRTIVTDSDNQGGMDGQWVDIARMSPATFPDPAVTSLSTVDENRQLATASEPVSTALRGSLAETASNALSAPGTNAVSEQPLPPDSPGLIAAQTVESVAKAASERHSQPDSETFSEAQYAPVSDLQSAVLSDLNNEDSLSEPVADPLWDTLSQNDWDQVPETFVDTALDVSLSTDTLVDAGMDMSQIAYLQSSQAGKDQLNERADMEYSGIDLHESEPGRDATSSFNAIRTLIEEASAIIDGDFEQTRESVDQDEPDEMLERQSANIRFAVGSKTISEQMDTVLTDIFNTLSRDVDSRIKVSVTTNEGENSRQNVRLSQERGRALIARLVSQGIDFSRFSLEALGGEGGIDLIHTVRVELLPAPRPSGQ